MSSWMSKFGGSHVLSTQNSDFGRPIHKCLCNSNFANNKGIVVIFGVRSQEAQVLSLPKLFMGLSYPNIHTFPISVPKTGKFQIMKVEISDQVRFLNLVTHSEKHFQLL